MISYKIDLDKPFTIIQKLGPDQYLVVGTAKTYRIAGGYTFGGNEGTWTLKMWDLFTSAQRKSVRWYQRIMGENRAKRRINELSAKVIASHSPK